MRLSAAQLNRATLARQSLLERAPDEPVEAVERLAGLQAQEAATPFIALWTRLEDFDADGLRAAIAARHVVKAALHRSTLHLVGRDDYLGSISAISLVTRTKWMSEQRGRPVHRDLASLTADALAYAAEPRSNAEMRAHAETLGEPVPTDELWRRIRRYGPFIAAPDEATWSYDRRPRHVAAAAWLDGEPLEEEASLAHVVRRHLIAFGPARIADISQWSGIGRRRLARGAELIDDLVRHEAEDGAKLLDIEGAPLPAGDTPAPPRLLPMWDETLLAYADRSRVLPEAHRKTVIAPNGDVAPTILIDGHVAGRWWAEEDGAGGSAIVLEPFAPLAKADRRALEVEAAALAAFIGPREPAVYRRYRR